MKRFLQLICFIAISSLMLAQNVESVLFREKSEIFFKFAYTDKARVIEAGNFVSIDNVKENVVYAYANKTEFTKFLALKIPYEVLPNPSDIPNVKMSSNVDEIKAWDTYPTYDGYLALMTQFQTQYPNLCKIYEIGTTVQNRKLLVAKISDNVAAYEAEPGVFYASSIHGDETTGYIMMLHLIDYLLSQYGTNAQVTNLVNNLQIWICPLSNPDGTYHSGNSTVSGATRGNANGVDMNRNFPDPAAGAHPDGNAYQPEVTAMMNFGAKYKMFHSANFHGGAEVVNYPWDTWSRLHPDNTWMVSTYRMFADTVHRYAVSGYLTDLDNGITNGYAWYRVTGGRQDYFTYFLHGREVTIEISNTKTPAASTLPSYWEYLYRSLLNNIEVTLYGIKGVVTNTLGQPLKAKITIQNHEADNSEILTDSLTGAYVRMIAPGTYTVVVSADSCITQTFTNVQVLARQATQLNVQLQPVNQPVLFTWQSVLNVSDNGGQNQAMVFGAGPTATNGIDAALGEVSLPPVPPTSVFDTRFELPVTPAEYSLKDFRKDTLTSGSWIIKFQPGAGGYPFTFSWNPATLPAGTFALKDIVTGTVINVDMKAQSSVAISNTGISALKIEYSKQTCGNIAMTQGWNIISVPLTAPNMAVTALFPQATSQAYAFSGGYVISSSLSAGQGYWLRYPQASSVSVCGTAVTGNSIPLAAGWNLIGVYLNNVPVSGISTTPANIINSVFYGYDNGYVNASSLQSGKGYWVRTTQAGTMNLPVSAENLHPAVLKKDYSHFNRILVNDKAGNSVTLYTTISADALTDDYELPPVPPQGIFDARFTSQKNVESVTGSGQTIALNSAEYPVTIQVKGTTLRFYDKATGGKIINLVLNNGESLQINDELVSEIVVASLETPADFALNQNYPNPFNPSTTISYSLPKAGFTTLKIYNILGGEVATLVSANETAGKHTITFDAAKLNSGVYFYTLKSANFSATRKLMVIK